MAEGGNINDRLMIDMLKMFEQGKITMEQYMEFCDRIKMTPQMLEDKIKREEEHTHKEAMDINQKGHEQRMKHLQDRATSVNNAIDKHHDTNKQALESRTKEIKTLIENTKTTGYVKTHTEKKVPWIWGEPKDWKTDKEGEQVIDQEGNRKKLDKVSETYAATHKIIQHNKVDIPMQLEDNEQFKQIKSKISAQE